MRRSSAVTQISMRPELLNRPPASITGSMTKQSNVPAGTFTCTLYDIRGGDGRAGLFYIEAEYPHRIVKWSLPPDVSGELTGSARLEYWKLHKEGDESYLEQIGLDVPRGQ